MSIVARRGTQEKEFTEQSELIPAQWELETPPELSTKGMPFGPKISSEMLTKEEAESQAIPDSVQMAPSSLFGFHFRKFKSGKDSISTLFVLGGNYDPVTQTFIRPFSAAFDPETGPEGSTGRPTGLDGIIFPDVVTDPTTDF